MNTRRLVLVALVLSSFFHAAPAVAQIYFNDPCRGVRYQADDAQRGADRASDVLNRTSYLYAGAQERVELQLSKLQSAIDVADNNRRAVYEATAVQTTTCAIGWFYWYYSRYNCVNTSVNSGIYRRGRADANYKAAVARRNSYKVYAQGYLQRQAARLEDAQNRYDLSLTTRNAAQARYADCRASNPCPLVPYYGRCY